MKRVATPHRTFRRLAGELVHLATPTDRDIAIAFVSAYVIAVVVAIAWWLGVGG